jgi:Ca2+-binding EF-hand superfamily protein
VDVCAVFVSILTRLCCFAEVSHAKKHDLFELLDADHDGVLSVQEQRSARAYMRED